MRRFFVEASNETAANDKLAKVSKPKVSPADSEPRNFLVAFLLTMVGGVLGLRHFYLGDKKLGWIRSGLFAGGYVWIILMAFLGQAILAMLGFFAVSVAGIWSIVDFFYVYNAVKTDAEGKPLTATVRDRYWARVFYLAAIIGFVAALVIGIVGGAFIENEIRNGNWSPTGGSNMDPYNSQDFNMDGYLKQLEQQNKNNSPSY
jgi:hypothetical protein